jgi:hypothetical protein
MEYLIDTKSRRIATWLDALMPSMLAQLNLSKRAGFVLVTVSKQENEGLAQELFAGSFVVSLKKGMTLEKFGLSLAHELTHVKQFATGKLSDTKNGSRIWNGVKYPRKTPYMNQPWELQAFANQEIIFRRALEA